jgi:hypothetical protein
VEEFESNGGTIISLVCPECGAQLEDGINCQSIFDSFLALEFSDPEYGKVHFITVACFMIQHGRYSDAALAWIQPALRAYLEEGLPVNELRRYAGAVINSSERSWKVLRAAQDKPLRRVNWRVTIADVAAHTGNAADYCACVRQWGMATLEQMGTLQG